VFSVSVWCCNLFVCFSESGKKHAVTVNTVYPLSQPLRLTSALAGGNWTIALTGLWKCGWSGTSPCVVQWSFFAFLPPRSAIRAPQRLPSFFMNTNAATKTPTVKATVIDRSSIRSAARALSRFQPQRTQYDVRPMNIATAVAGTSHLGHVAFFTLESNCWERAFAAHFLNHSLYCCQSPSMMRRCCLAVSSRTRSPVLE